MEINSVRRLGGHQLFIVLHTYIQHNLTDWIFGRVSELEEDAVRFMSFPGIPSHFHSQHALIHVGFSCSLSSHFNLAKPF